MNELTGYITLWGIGICAVQLVAFIGLECLIRILYKMIEELIKTLKEKDIK